MGRRHSYKKNFMPPEQVSYWWPKILPELQNYHTKWQSQSSHPSLLCAQYLNIFFHHFYQKPISSHYTTNVKLAQLPTELDVWNKNLFRGVKAAVNRTLINWYLDLYPLELYFHIPEPLEVLKQQAQGKRCVSCLLTLPDQGYVLGDRDPWSFLIHDLIHADQFYFQNKSQKEQQLLCYLFLLGYQLEIWQPLWQSHPQAQPELEYIFSDMNSHPIHILKTLKSILVRYQYLDNWSTPLISKAPEMIQAWWLDFLDLNTKQESSLTHKNIMIHLQNSPSCR